MQSLNIRMDRKLIILLLTLTGVLCAFAQEITLPVTERVHADSLSILVPDTLLTIRMPDTLQTGTILPGASIADDLSTEKFPTDTLTTDSATLKKSPLDAPVNYTAKDSIVMTGKNWAYLYGEGNVKYENIELQSELIEMSMDSSLVFAKFGLDSVGDEFGYPLFTQGDQQYESKMMRYNFKSKKGYITDVITQQGEGYVTSGRTKKMPDDALYMVDGKYTTCDEHDHPHFYIQMTKAKVRPGKNIVTGPVYLVIEDVPLPLALPFCFFPFTESYSSGILMPTFGDESTRGYFLRDGGYYFALSDYMDLAVLGEIYTKGSWGLSTRSTYRKRYKFSGSFNASYIVTQVGDKIPHLAEGKTSDYSKTKDFKLQWTHTQDAKANPYLNFSASVNFATQSYDRNNTMSHYNGDMTQNTKSSSVNVTKRFANSPFSLSATANVNQVTRDTTVALTLPNVSITMSRIYPLKRKNAIGKERWYEKISMSYTGYFNNSIQTKEYLLFKSNLIKDWKNSMEHTIPVQATFSLFKYLNITPSFNYKERWYTSNIEQRYDASLHKLMPADTTYGFYRIFDYSAAVSAATTLYGFYQPVIPFFGVEMIRHRFEPSVSFSATPDFGSSKYGYWESYSYMDANGEMHMGKYSPFAHNGSIPGQSGKSGSLNFSIANNLEAKVKSESDSTGIKKISLIDNLSMGMSYNLAADSFKWSDVNVGLRLKITKSYTLNLNAIFDTYRYTADANGNPRRKDVPRWKDGGLPRFKSTSTSFSYTFNNDTFKNLFGGNKDNESTDSSQPPVTPFGEEGSENDFGPDALNENEAQKSTGGRMRTGEKTKEGEYDEDGYMVNTIPWSLSFSYGLQVGYGSFDTDRMEYRYKFGNSLSFNGNIQPTKNWRINFNATYDFDAGKISFMTLNLSRNMHCFQMTASIVPVGRYKSYSFSIAVSSSLLKDLKYDKSSNYRDGQSWY